MQYLPFFLTEAAPLPELVAYLETNQLDPIRAKELPREAWAVDKAKVEEEVAAYLQVSPCDGNFSSPIDLNSSIEMSRRQGYSHATIAKQET